MHKTAYIGIVAYNPDVREIASNVRRILSKGCKLFIVDNNSSNYDKYMEAIEDEIDDCSWQQMTVINNNNNYGIAKALNQIVRAVTDAGGENVVLLDQDSEFPIEDIQKLTGLISDKVGIAAPAVRDKFGNYILHTRSTGMQCVEKVITSGSAVNVRAWQEVGGYDEKLFMDAVDFDFCKRLRIHGYSILVNHDVIMNHELGSGRTKKVLLWNINYYWHSKTRYYYIIRNIIYLERKYGNREIPIALCRILKQWVNIMVFYDDKIQMFRIFIKAIRDGMQMPVDIITVRRGNKI